MIEEDLSLIQKIIYELIILLVFVYLVMHFVTIIKLNNLNNSYSNIVAVYGGFTDELYADFKSDLNDIGFKEKDTTINIKAIAVDGTDISKKILNVDYLGKTDAKNFAQRGTKISIEVISNKPSVVNGIFNLISGGKSSIKKGYDKKVVMSERVK